VGTSSFWFMGATLPARVDENEVVASLRGHLLIAAPSLFDYFRRSVILVIEHNEDGAMGVVLNRTSKTTVGEAVPALGEVAGDEPVRIGGPVAPEAVVALGEFDDPDGAGTLVVDNLGTLDPDRPEAVPRRIRVYAGYAGWAGGQLDAELEQGAWIAEPASPEDPFRDGDLWADALQRKGGQYALLATMPADPTSN
jgi:putative transcriptional regulator